MTNRYDYVSNYSKILELSLYHEFFVNNELVAFDLIPDKETNDLIKNYNLILRKKENTFIILKSNNSNLSSVVFTGPIAMSFILKFNDLLFLNKTDIPFQYNQKFVLKSTDSDKNRLHPNTYVDESIIEPYDDNGLIGHVLFELNQNNEFFGFEDSESDVKPLKLYARFNSRIVKFRFNFYYTKNEKDFSNFFVYDENTNERYNDFSSRMLENGMEVQSFVMPKEVKMNETYNHKLFLKKEDEFNKSFNKFLPHPTPNNLKFDAESNTFFLESFIKIN
jgi:hypothetical protein